jgi:2Fe-2S ferredoxin
MPVIHFIQPDFSVKSIDEPHGTLMSVALAHNIAGLDAECGGCCICGGCHVHVDEAFVDLMPPMEADEREMLALVHPPRVPESRLACQLFMADLPDGLVVSVAGD